jgi:hypothetical protein
VRSLGGAYGRLVMRFPTDPDRPATVAQALGWCGPTSPRNPRSARRAAARRYSLPTVREIPPARSAALDDPGTW